MKSSIALLATAAAVSATFVKTEWIVDVVTVTVIVDPSDGVQTPSISIPTPESVSTPSISIPTPESVSTPSISIPTPESVSTPSAAPSPPSPISHAEKPEPITTTTTTTTEAPPPTSTIEPEPVVHTPTPEPQPETATKPQPSSQPQPETPAPADGYQGTAVKYHNAYRQDHSAGELSWDSTLAEYALQLAKTCNFEHDTSMGGEDFHFGQNLASLSGTDLGSMDSAVGSAIAKQWYGNEVNYYNFYGQKNPKMDNFMKFGHFSQLVWKGSQKVGCATFECPVGNSFTMPTLYTVCNYSPPGNVEGEYKTNVLPSLGLKVSL